MSDAADVAALIRTAFAAQSVVTDPPPSALRVTAADVAVHLRQGGGAVATGAGALIGSVLWVEQLGGLYLARLAVAPLWRRRGVGLPRLILSTRLALLNNCRLCSPPVGSSRPPGRRIRAMPSRPS
ncbi:MAG TPA: hypothetical protein VFL55_25055 [Acetobacteraceae bacterium]|nr:hypothetical protein [Acetobacteraceae bacterium]